MHQLSQQLFVKAQRIIPGGVNSPVRAFKSVGGTPIFLKRGYGAHIIDVDDREYIDYVCSWGALILGHAPVEVVQAVTEAAAQGMSFGAPTLLEIELAEKILSHLPAMDMIRMVNSGTEATMTAIRLARGFTRKAKIIKFNGCYHGHSDSLLVKAGSGVLTCGIPSSPGILPAVAEHTLIADFNNLASTRALFEQHGDDIAAVIIEPVAGNMGMILPNIAFLQELRQLCDHYQTLLIFDEVMTGFRVALGGAQAIYNVAPDLTTLGKVIGGGMPIGAIAGKRDIMLALAPVGPVYQAGTLAGNPVAMAAGLATLSEVEKPGFYQALARNTASLIEGLKEAAESVQIRLHGVSLGGMFGFCFSDRETIENYQDIANSDVAMFNKFFHGMLKEGVSFAPSLFEAGFVSAAHQMADIIRTQEKAARVLSQCKQS